MTKPTWASVSIDGKNKGDTPITLEIASGMHTIKTRRGGFKEAEKTVCVKPSDEPMVVTIEMSK